MGKWPDQLVIHSIGLIQASTIVLLLVVVFIAFKNVKGRRVVYRAPRRDVR